MTTGRQAAARQGARYRLGVASRALAAAAGGYCVAALLAILLAVSLPSDPLDRGMTGTLVSLLVLPLLAMLCFWVRSAARAWAIMLALALALAALSRARGWRP